MAVAEGIARISKLSRSLLRVSSLLVIAGPAVMLLADRPSLRLVHRRFVAVCLALFLVMAILLLIVGFVLRALAWILDGFNTPPTADERLRQK